MKQTASCALVLVLAATFGLLLTGCPKRSTIAVPEADIVVASDGSGDYESISEAVENASNGDVVFVKAGVYEEEVEVEDLSELVLAGAGPDKAIIDADDEYAALTLVEGEIEVYGFTIKGASSHGVYIKDGHHRIHHCLIVDNEDRGIYFSSFSGDPTAEIDHCTIVDNGVSGIYIPTDDKGNRVTNCIIASDGRGIVSDENTGNIVIEHNCLYNDGNNLDKVNEGEGNVFEDPGFADPYDGDYRLSSGSPCKGAATDGGDLGCF